VSNLFTRLSHLESLIIVDHFVGPSNRAATKLMRVRGMRRIKIVIVFWQMILRIVRPIDKGLALLQLDKLSVPIVKTKKSDN